MINVGIPGRAYYRVLGLDSNGIIYNKVTNNKTIINSTKKQ
jgi:hypothetical protein